jgi:hypothetical protein
VFIFGTVSAGLVGHIIADTLSVGGGMKIRPFWPMNWAIALGLWKADSERGNQILLRGGLCQCVSYSGPKRSPSSESPTCREQGSPMSPPGVAH